MGMTCWFDQFSEKPCYVDWLGMMQCHLFSKSVLKQDGIVDQERVWDERIWRWGCAGHHHSFDAGFLIVPRAAVGDELEPYLRELGESVGLPEKYVQRFEQDKRFA
jgi:hypothetical protein